MHRAEKKCQAHKMWHRYTGPFNPCNGVALHKVQLNSGSLYTGLQSAAWLCWECYRTYCQIRERRGEGYHITHIDRVDYTEHGCRALTRQYIGTLRFVEGSNRLAP